MKIIISLTFCKNNLTLNIQVNSEQKIIDVLDLINQNLGLNLSAFDHVTYIRAKNEQRYISPFQTFQQAEVYSGEHLIINN